MSFVFSALGLFALIYRLGFRRTERRAKIEISWPKVSILVPARDEAHNLAQLLPSLMALDYPHFEVIVIDDSSTDQTATMARQFPVQVIEAGTKPEAWVGKTWACAQGAQAANGELFLFTDADTVHHPQSLKRAVGFLRQTSSVLVTAPPYHLAQAFWERALGFFLILPLILTAYRQPPTLKRKFAIGQYILFDSVFYRKLGGHESVRNSLAEDLDLADLTLKQNGHLSIYPEAELYSVRMFASVKEFAAGWTRLFRLGLNRSSARSVLELVLVFKLFLAPDGLAGVALLLLGLLFLGLRLRDFGQFSWESLIFYPLSALAFTMLSARAVVMNICSRPIVWRTRSYSE